MKQAPRHPKFPIGRVCHICGQGGTVRKGGVLGAHAILLALGYEVDRSKTLGFAHVCCIERARAKLKQVS